jgi:hypothetical protein
MQRTAYLAWMTHTPVPYFLKLPLLELGRMIEDLRQE